MANDTLSDRQPLRPLQDDQSGTSEIQIVERVCLLRQRILQETGTQHRRFDLQVPVLQVDDADSASPQCFDLVSVPSRSPPVPSLNVRNAYNASSKQSSSNGSCIRACSTAQPAVKELPRQTAWMQTTETEDAHVTFTLAAVSK